MTPLLWLTGALFVGGPLLLAGAALVDAGRSRAGGARRVWQAALLTSILTAPIVPGIPLASAERARIIEGPDLLSGAPLVRTPAPTRTAWLGLLRIEVVRETQDGRLLREIRTDVLILPLLPLLLGLGWFRARGRGSEDAEDGQAPPRDTPYTRG